MVDPNCCMYRRFTNDIKIIERKPTWELARSQFQCHPGSNEGINHLQLPASTTKKLHRTSYNPKQEMASFLASSPLPKP